MIGIGVSYSLKHSNNFLCMNDYRTQSTAERLLRRAKSHLTSEGTSRVALASVNAKAWTSSTEHTWMKVVLVDEPGEAESQFD